MLLITNIFNSKLKFYHNLVNSKNFGEEIVLKIS
jgi:hypothetical protein